MATTYTVQTGDTLFSIATRFGTTVEMLAQLNSITNLNVISVGQQLVTPDSSQTGNTGQTSTTANMESVVSAGDTLDNVMINRIIQQIQGLQYSISTDKSVYNRGENVVITLIKSNISGSRITLNYRTAQRFDFVVRRGEREVWRWSQGRSFAQGSSQVILRPGERQVFRAVWNQRNNRGELMPSGNFTVEGFNFAQGLRNRGISTTLRIRAMGPTPTPTVSPTACPDINILVNQGFEDWPNPARPPAGWTGNNLYRTTTSLRGNYAAELGAVHNERAILSQRVNIEAGRIYDLNWSARENIQPGGVARYVLLVEIFYFDRANNFVGRTEPRYSQENIPDNAYQRYSLSTGRVPSGTRVAEIRFTFEPSGANNNTVKIDNVELLCRF